MDLDDGEAMRAATKMLPETKRIALLAGSAPSDRAVYDGAERFIRQKMPGIEIIPLIGQSVPSLQSRVETLPKHTIVYLTQFSYDSEGRNMTLAAVTSALASRSNSPFFSGSTLSLGSGIVGGPLNSFERGGQYLGLQLAQVLKGARPDNLPIASVPHLQAVDWRELKRWNIPESRLPAGTELRFRKLTLWEEHRSAIVSFATAILLQGIIIGALLTERRRRNRADQKAHANEELNRAILSSASGRVAILNQAGQVLRLSEHWNFDGNATWLPEVSVGADYLSAWRTWGRLAEGKEQVLASIKSVLEGRESSSVVECGISLPPENGRWVRSGLSA